MDVTGQMGSIVDSFHASGLRWTPQRQAVVEMLLRLPQHPTAEEIYASVRRRHPGLSRATVYNTMEALAAMGRVKMVTAPDGTRRYDPNPTPHHHLRCRSCGSITDLAADRIAPAPQPTAGRLHGFRVESAQIEYHGICSTCDRSTSGGASKVGHPKGGAGRKLRKQ